MAQTDLFIGAANIYVGGSAPATGSGTKMSFTSGVPSTGGTIVGLTGGPATFKLERTKKEIEVEQALSPVKVLAINELVTLEFSIKEIDFSKLQQYMTGTSLTVDSSSTPHTRFIAGGGSALVPTSVVTLVATDVTKSPTVYTGICLYQAYMSETFEIPFAKGTDTMVKVVMKALADTTRPIGDQTYQIVQQY